MNKSIRPRDNKGRFVKTTKEVVPTVSDKTKPPTKPPIKSSTKPPTTNLLTGNKKETREMYCCRKLKENTNKEIVEQPEETKRKTRGLE
jgi:hypothetical protein